MHGLWVFHGNIWTFSASCCFVVAGWAHDLASFCCERQNRRRETLYDPLSKHKSLVPVSSLLSISIATHICSLNILVRFNSMCSEVDHISKKKRFPFFLFAQPQEALWLEQKACKPLMLKLPAIVSRCTWRCFSVPREKPFTYAFCWLRSHLFCFL